MGSGLKQVLLDSALTTRGHFLYESGHHGDLWLDLDALFTDPRRTHGWVSALAKQASSCKPEVVCGPLTGGAFVAQALATEMGASFIYSERIISGAVQYRIPRSLRRGLASKRVLLVDDAINAGSAVGATLTELLECGAKLVGLASLMTLGQGASHIAVQQGVPHFTLATLESSLWAAAECPLCGDGVPLLNPGA